MDYNDWSAFFGRSAEDRQVREALARAGISKQPVLKRDETRRNIELKDMMLIFAAGELFPSRNVGGDGSCLLIGAVLPIKDQKWGEYGGDLPFGLDRSNSQETLRQRWGGPRESDEDFYWDEWKVENLLIRATYTEDYQALADVTVEMPSEV